jgi:hypothetical protein
MRTRVPAVTRGGEVVLGRAVIASRGYPGLIMGSSRAAGGIQRMVT